MGFESSLTAAHLHWSKINLSQLQKELDEQSLQVIQTQAQSFESRKILVEHTKELKKKEDPTIIDFKSLLKEYQAEIDLINKRSKNAETLFLGLYKVFAEVPDPCPVFESALQKSKQLQNLERIETNNEKLRDDLETAQLEITLLKENEQTINQLKLDLSNFENSLESRVSERVATATLELQADMDERHIIYKETENSLKKQLNHAKEQLASLQNNQEFTQASIIINNEESSRSAEMEILTLDLENANSKREHILKENLLLKEQLRKVKDDSRYLELKKQFEEMRLEHEHHQHALDQNLQKQKIEQENKEKELENRLKDLDRELQLQKFVVAEKTQLLEEYQDYEEIKKELDIFKCIEMDADINQVQDIPLERLLLEKNKKLENQFTAIKMENQDMMTNINENILQLTKFKSEIDTKTLLIQRLESDIHRLNEIQERHQKSPSFENLIQELDQTTPPSGRRNDSTIVPILTSQRDRYKQRFEESHRKSITMQSQFQDLTDENSRLQKDNLILYEKLKYQDSYSSQTNIQLENINQRNTVTDKYKNMYDIEIDPFQKFKAKERKRGENLGVPERIAMGFTKLLTMNKYSRLVFVVYSGLLHLLVFFCMFELATLDRVRNRQTSFSIPNKPLTK